MKLTTAVGFLIAFLLGTIAIDVGSSQSSRCATGHVRGFAVVTGDSRLGGIGAIPNQFTGDPLYFGIRYNCTAKGVLAKRVDEGVYDVWFPDNPARVAQVSALTNGTSASVYRVTDFVFRVIIRGPIIRNEILVVRDSPFQITVF